MSRPKIKQKGIMYHPSYSNPIDVEVTAVHDRGYVSVMAYHGGNGVESYWTMFCNENEILWGAGNTKCECGSSAVGHPGHSYFCPSFEENE